MVKIFSMPPRFLGSGLEQVELFVVSRPVLSKSRTENPLKILYRQTAVKLTS